LGEGVPPSSTPSTERGESCMTASIKAYRYELLHGDDADFVAYQRGSDTGIRSDLRVPSIWYREGHESRRSRYQSGAPI
jgi:hypothetical protein